MLGDDFSDMGISDRENLVFELMNNKHHQSTFNQDVRYEDIMAASNSKSALGHSASNTLHQKTSLSVPDSPLEYPDLDADQYLHSSEEGSNWTRD